MPERRCVQQFPKLSPLRQGFVHQRREPVIVARLQQMQQLVHYDVFEALRRLLGQLQVEPDAAGIRVATAPFGFHLFDAPACCVNTQLCFPLF